jgi:hypothetical protein
MSEQSKCAAAFNEIKEFRSCFDKLSTNGTLYWAFFNKLLGVCFSTNP